MKSIWILNQYIIKPDTPGGTRHIDIAAELVARGYNVHLFTAGFHHLMMKECVLDENENYRIENYKGILIHWLQVRPYKSNGVERLLSMISFYFALLKESERLMKSANFIKPDIIIGSTVHLFTVLASWKISKKIGSRFIMEVRDLWPYTLIATGQMSKYHPLSVIFGILERYLYRKAEKIIVLPDKAYKYIGRYTDTNKIIWIPNSFNTDLLKTIDGGNEIVPSPKFRIVFAGSMNKLDNIWILVKAYEIAKKQIDGIELILIGDGMEKSSLESYILKQNIRDVIMYRPIPKNRILSYLSCADVLWVGMPDSDIYKYGISFNKLYDYMAVKKPVILSVPENTSNIISSAGCGITARAEDSNDLSEIIIRVYNMKPEQRNELGEKGFSYLLDNFTTHKMVDKLETEVIRES